MADQWIDDFQGYGTDESLMTNGLYAFVSTATAIATDPDPSISTTVYRPSGSGQGDNQSMRFVLSSAQATVGISQRIWLDSLPDAGTKDPGIMCWNDLNNVQLCVLKVTPTGALSLIEGDDIDDSGSEVAATSGPVITADAWQHIEAKCLLDSTTGTIEVRVEGVVVLTATGLNTSNADLTCSIVSWRRNNSNTSSGITWYIKDLYVWDGSGGVNDDFAGSVAIHEMLPTGDDTLNWDVSTGSTGWDLIDEVPPNDDTDYISADDTPPSASLFDMGDLPADVTTVRTVMTVARAKKTDGGDGSLQMGVKSGASTGTGTDNAITTSYTYYFDFFPVDPATSVAWTPSAVDDALLQLDRTV